MMFRLRDNLHWCVSGGRVIFLDVEADRYFSLCGASEQAFVRLSNGKMRPEDVEPLRTLLDRGMLIDDPKSPGIRQALPVQPPSGDFMQTGDCSSRFLDLLAGFAAEVRVARQLRSRPLLELLEDAGDVHTRRPLSPPEAEERIARILSASSAVSLMHGSADRCLVRALAVQAICRRNGIFPQLIFGVRVNPFGAHCWLQLDRTVLIGEFEQARLFTPIMSVR